MHSSFKKTFTLIEMLIVIVIIGILASALVPRLQDMQARARDSKRKIDLKSIHDAVMVYFADNGQYPLHINAHSNAYSFVCPNGTWYNKFPCFIGSAGFASPGTQWFPGISSYLWPVPFDPINTNTEYIYGRPQATGSYNYYYGNVYNSPNTFDLGARLENRQDPDRCAVKWYTFWLMTATCSAPGFFAFYDGGMGYDYSPPYWQ